MKKALLPLLLIVGALAPVAAQFNLDIHGGANISRYRYPAKNEVMEDPQGFLPGYYFGVTPGWKRSAGKFEFSLPVQYAERNYSIAKDAAPFFHSKERLQYIEINPRIGYAVAEDIVVALGVYWSYLLQASTNVNEVWQILPEKDWFQDTDLGLTGAFIWHINRFSVHGGAQFGLGDISGITYTFVNGEEATFKKHQLGFQLGVGYRLFGSR